MKKTLIVLLLQLFLGFDSLYLHAQEELARSNTADSLGLLDNDTRHRYFTPSVGYNSLLYRDFATSPLFYRGAGLHLGLAWLTREAERWESTYQMGLNTGFTFADMPESNYFQGFTSSTFVNAQLYGHYLRQINTLSNDKLKIKVGPALASDLNFRFNGGLGNAGAGSEILLNLMLGAQAVYDFSRKESKEQDWLLFTRKLRPIKRELSFQLNVGVLNFNYRPGYAYLSDFEFDGSDTSPLVFLYGGHKLYLNGYRLRTHVAYTSYRQNGNAHSWSYHWDAAHAPGGYEIFQMAIHRFQYTLMFHRSKK
ncbi:MAG: hypothetical protein JJT94_00930 [Bernardetiaceae bacterium]|nr:hypothetical protein [Bernardetiaceae bacterium]